MITTCIASTDVDLTTTGFVKQLLDNTTSTVNDARLSALIRAASRWAETYVGYPLSVATYQETLPSYDRRLLVLDRTPIRAVKRLMDSTDTGSAGQVYSSDFRVEDREAGFLSRDEGWYWTAPGIGMMSLRPDVGQEYKPWLADYVAGWTLSGLSTDSPHWSTVQGSTSTGRTLPEDIEVAVALKVLNDYTNPLGSVREKLGDLEVEYRSGSATEQPSSTPWHTALEPYRRMI